MKLASQRQSILKVDAFLQKLKEEYDLGEDVFSRMLVSVNEAVTNAIVHGNTNDPFKSVIVDYERSETGTFIFTITDEGEGFAWQRKEAVFVGKEGSEREGGRGLLLIEKLADKHIFNTKGNSIALYFTV